MNCFFRVNAIAAAALIVISPITAPANPRSHPLNEDAALELLHRTLKRDQVHEKRISLDWISYITEEKTKAYFQFVLREIHNTKCGGVPEVSPVIDPASIGIPAKSSNMKPLKTTGTCTRARKLSSVRTQIAPAEASAIMISDSNGGDRRP
ncbi:MAG TPA: hypothetical protein VKE29_01610 [Candidatus Udaeobacter sp.]|nr:hypothetical protein [Candidatus Udaeobacter sp.]